MVGWLRILSILSPMPRCKARASASSRPLRVIWCDAWNVGGDQVLGNRRRALGFLDVPDQLPDGPAVSFGLLEPFQAVITGCYFPIMCPGNFTPR